MWLLIDGYRYRLAVGCGCAYVIGSGGYRPRVYADIGIYAVAGKTALGNEF